ncbi:chemokine-like protein TAFA-2 [Clavelina lepadiformis]|uniref:Uncharacterized protein n=1 Tax=Clavelina lepadiformis TaxID=159417 RepID=A0ABP0GHP9_CLALP
MRGQKFAFRFAAIYFSLQIFDLASSVKEVSMVPLEIDIFNGPGGHCTITMRNRCCMKDHGLTQQQRAKCTCVSGYVAGTTKGQPSCVHKSIKSKKKWCQMKPCLEDEKCALFINKFKKVEGWECKKGSVTKRTKIKE